MIRARRYKRAGLRHQLPLMSRANKALPRPERYKGLRFHCAASDYNLIHFFTRPPKAFGPTTAGGQELWTNNERNV